MVDYFATAGAFTALLTLGAAGAGHLHHPRSLAEALVAQGLLPKAAAGLAARVIGSLEAAIAGLGLLALTPGLAGQVSPKAILGVAASLYAIFSLYVALLLRRQPGAPCGCSAEDHPLNGWVVFRSSSLGAAALLASILVERIIPLETFSFRLMVSVLTALAFGMVLWNLPEAMSVPAKRQQARDQQSEVRAA
ncbi:MAG: MauE/DoxX family redox-associated membrane protein [bacterium]